MNMIPDLFRSDWANALGWTLLHSLWQSVLILLMVLVSLRFIPGTYSRVRYFISCAGLALIMVTGVVTFLSLMDQSPASHPAADAVYTRYEFTASPSAWESPVAAAISDLAGIIQQHMPLVITVWLAGLLFFGLRMLTGIAYAQRLTSSAVPVENKWTAYIHGMTAKLGIVRLVSLAESHLITAPVVIGYFKPVVLIPMGMLTGLTTEQLETIFLHELAHIRRHDYLVNLIQSVIETLLFFNPVVWILSELIRKEREFCCDDLVIRSHGHANAYAHALVKLEEVRLTRHAFALSLADNKNQLLNRIRRIMEKSVTNYSGKSRVIIPALVLAAGLFCVSWLSIGQDDSIQQKGPMLKDNSATVPDSVKPDKKKGMAWYSKKRIVTTDENGKPHEEIVEKFKGDESLRPMMEKGFQDFSQVLPQGFPANPFLPNLNPGNLADSLPPSGFGPDDQKEWEEFSKSFRDHFGKGFEQFYSFRGLDPSDLMKQFHEDFQWPQGFDNFDFPEDSMGSFPGFDDDVFENLREQMKGFRDMQMEHFRNWSPDTETHADNFERYEDALSEQLMKDGYLSEGETIRSMEWSDDTFKVNGKDIKPEDRQKYRDLHDRYLGTSKYSGRRE